MEHTFMAANVLTKDLDLGANVTIIGGGLVGCETALFLAQKGKKISIVEALDKILAINGPLCHSNYDMLKMLIPYNGIEVISNAKATGYEGGSLILDNGETTKFDSVVLSVGYKENNSLYEELQFEIPKIYILGDAKNVSNILY